MKFFNREKEINKILAILENKTFLINFVYGPINSGKTALINEIITNKLDKKKYIPFYFNFRCIYLRNCNDILISLFEEYNKNTTPLEVIKQTLEESPIINRIPIHENTFNEILRSNTSLSKYIINLLSELKNQELQPILIFDELQKISHLKYPKPLISSFFKFLTYITEFQLTHVFCMTSDVLFMEDVAFHILSNEVNYILVDDFDKETTLKFMDFFSKEKLNRTLTNEEKELIYSYVGGNPMDIIWVIDNMRIHDLKESLDKFLKLKVLN
ncbi:ATP-binding protein [Methanocaldococcus sp.]|uniref:ATP-binding protein n=1 Tax=Methanocaldococcus sp. TaxID=2152917 RepID=UPI0034572CAD